jgi:hypothetical protein
LPNGGVIRLIILIFEFDFFETAIRLHGPDENMRVIIRNKRNVFFFTVSIDVTSPGST